MLDAGEHDAQGHSRKDVSIVALARLKPLPVQLEGGEWRPRGEHTASLAPSVSLCSSKFIGEGLDKLNLSVLHGFLACSAVHSALLVGLLRANMMGLSLSLAIVLTISSVKTAGMAAAPIKAVGFSSSTISPNSVMGACS